MKRLPLIVVLLFALLAIFITTSQAYPVVVSELAIDLPCMAGAIEIDCSPPGGGWYYLENIVANIDIGGLFNSQNTYTLCKNRDYDRNLRGRWRSGTFAVNIGFDRESHISLIT